MDIIEKEKKWVNAENNKFSLLWQEMFHSKITKLIILCKDLKIFEWILLEENKINFLLEFRKLILTTDYDKIKKFYFNSVEKILELK